jgi:double-stranded uracil-DNA glycosylase
VSPRVLPDYLLSGLELVLVGINPGLRSAAKGHHFAGAGNKFWALLFESGLVPVKLGYEDDHRLPEFGIGIANIVARPSGSSSELGPSDYRKGRKLLVAKLMEHRPRAAALVGVTVLREIWPAISACPAPRVVRCGRIEETIGETALFVLPNPSGRNAHFSHREMLSHWRRLARWLGRTRPRA